MIMIHFPVGLSLCVDTRHFNIIYTGAWVADCHACGKVGPYRDPSCGRPRQHNGVNQKYCGYFRVHPRRVTEDSKRLKELNTGTIG